MAWTLDKSHADFKKWDILNPGEKQVWDAFQNAIRSHGVHPATAAQQLGTVGGKSNADYKCLSGKQYQIRLSYSHRATFEVRDAGGGNGTVYVLQVGGHT